MNTFDSSTSSKASGSRSKYTAPSIDPAENAISSKRMLCNVFSFRDKAKIPINEERLTNMVAMMIFVKLDNLLHFQ